MKRHILLIEDDPISQRVTKAMLDQAGFIVKECPEAFSALEELNKTQFDLVIMDLFLPHLSGLRMLANIRSTAALREIPIMILSGNGDKRTVVRASKLGVTEYVVKPAQKEDLLRRIERVLGGRPQFEEVILKASDTLAPASLSLEVQIRSISNNGMTVVAPVQLPASFLLKNFFSELFETLEIKPRKLKVIEAVPNEHHTFDHFVSFSTFAPEERQRLREWITTRTFEHRNTPIRRIES